MRGSARSTWQPRRAASATAAPCTEQFQNEALQPANPVLGRKTRLRFNQFGATLGGPVWGVARTFFFGSYQGRRHDTLSAGQTFVPPTAFRSGDFSSALGACAVSGGQPIPLFGPDGNPTGDCMRVGQIFDPATTIANPRFNPAQAASPFNPQFIRQPFAGNRIPTGRISTTAQALMAAQLPDPNFGDALNNYTGEAGAVLDYNQYAVRVDHTLTGKDRLYGRLAIQDNVRTNQPLIPYLSKNLQGKGRVFSSTWARVLGSSAVNEFRVGYVRGNLRRLDRRDRSGAVRHPEHHTRDAAAVLSEHRESQLRRILSLDHHRDAGHIPVG